MKVRITIELEMRDKNNGKFQEAKQAAANAALEVLEYKVKYENSIVERFSKG